MHGFPTWTTDARRFHGGALLTLTLFVTSSFAGTNLPELQALGARIKLASAQMGAGHPPSAGSLIAFGRELSLLGDTISAGGDARIRQKHQAVLLLLATLQTASAGPQSPGGGLASATRASPDTQGVTDNHGGACATALGISEKLPVRVTLATTGQGRSDAWFRFEPAAPGHFRFTTDSIGADPAIDIFTSDCAHGAQPVASNDDAFGLDAAVSLTDTDRKPLLIHLTNSAQGGPVILSVADAGASINGAIVAADGGMPIAGAHVALFNTDGSFTHTYGTSDSYGSYSIATNPGVFYVQAYANEYVSELYPDVLCSYPAAFDAVSNCPIAQAQAVVVGDGAVVSGIDIALTNGHSISGFVHDSSGNPVSSANLTLYHNSGGPIGFAYGDAFGRYRFTALTDGTYKVAAQAGGLGSQMFDHVACGGPLESQCDLTKATAINVASEDVAPVDFNLPSLASIQGIVSGPGAQPISAAQVCVLDALANPVGQCGFSDINGHYSAGPLPVGTYYVYASSWGYFSQLFAGSDCAQDCLGGLALGTPVAIDHDGAVGAASFQLHPLPVIHGHVQDAISGLPLPNVFVLASLFPPASNSFGTNAITDANGDYAINGVSAGKYYLLALSIDHVDEIYPSISCEQLGFPYYYSVNTACDVSGAILVTIAPGQVVPDFDFALPPESRITGQATVNVDGASDLPVQASVSAYNSAGVQVGTTYTDSLGRYVLGDLAQGTYYVVAGGYYYNGQFVTQIWHDVDCPNQCAPTTGTPLVVGQGTTASEVDFSLIRRDAVVGRVTDTSNAPVAGVLVDLFDAGTGIYTATAATNASGYYAVPAPVGSAYLVATESFSGFVDQVYSGIACPKGPAFFGLCPLAGATPVGLSYFISTARVVDFALQSNDPIFANGFESP